MPEVRQYTVYKFDEASDILKSKILEKHRDFYISDPDWYHNALYDFQNILENTGVIVSDNDISFSGFCSPGDGASFKPGIFDENLFIDHIVKDVKKAKRLKKLYNLSAFSFYTSKTYNYGNYTKYTLNIEFLTDNKNINKLLDEFESLVHEWHTKKSMDLYKILNKEYDTLTSDEMISEVLTINEYYFNNNGDID